MEDESFVSVCQRLITAPDATTSADVSNNTMGGLHIFDGYERFSQMEIVPLSATHFLAIYDNYSEASSATSASNPIQAFAGLVRTIVATDPSVGTPVSEAQQQTDIQLEASEYGLMQATPSTGSAPLSVAFSNIPPSAGAERIEFGDGQTSELGAQDELTSSITHVYATPGTYTATLYRSLPNVALQSVTVTVK